MMKVMVAALLVLCGWFMYQYALAPVYVTFSNEQQGRSESETTLYFWASDRDRDFFQVGQTYQLSAEQQKTQLILFSVAHAEVKPEALKLGFRFVQSEAFMPEHEKYQVILLP